MKCKECLKKYKRSRSSNQLQQDQTFYSFIIIIINFANTSCYWHNVLSYVNIGKILFMIRIITDETFYETSLP